MLSVSFFLGEFGELPAAPDDLGVTSQAPVRQETAIAGKVPTPLLVGATFTPRIRADPIPS